MKPPKALEQIADVVLQHRLTSFLNSCDDCGEKPAEHCWCKECWDKRNHGGEAPNIENRGLGSGIVESCTGCGAAEGSNHDFDCPEAQD